MSTRTRIFLSVLVVILLGYPLSAWVIGIVVEDQLRERERDAIQQVGPYWSIVERSYRRSVFGATETISIGLGTPGSAVPVPSLQKLASLRVTVRNTIHHGPFPGLRSFGLATFDTELVLPPEVQQRIDKLLGGKPLMTVHTSMGWLGGYRSDFASPAFSGEIGSHATISSGGMAGTGTTARDLASIK